MRTKTMAITALASLGMVAAASAQRVSWSISYSSGPVCVTASTRGAAWVSVPPVYVAPAPLVVAPPPAVVRWHPSVAHGGYRPCPPPPPRYCPPPPPPRPRPSPPPAIRRHGVYAYAPGPRRVVYPEVYGHPGIVQEWCPRSQTWITIGRQPRAW